MSARYPRMAGHSDSPFLLLGSGMLLGQQPLRPYGEPRLACGDVCRVSSAHRPSPRQNHLLAALPSEDYERLLPDLEPFPLAPGRSVHDAGAREKYVHFLTEGIVSRFHVTANGASAEFAVTGNEGVIGVASFLGGESTPSGAVALTPSHSYRLPAEQLRHEFDHGGPLPLLLLCYTRALIAQIGQIAACKRFHSLDQRLCRWILSCLDRVPAGELTMTQELIAQMLGVRREGVSEAAGKLQQAGLIHCSRGRIAVLDRPRLEAQACECYTIVKREYDRLLHPEGTRGNAGRHCASRQHPAAW
jgi:CRP-like cAMP-binding protein